MAQGGRSSLQGRRRGIDPWIRTDPLEEEMTTHFSIFAWEIPWREGPGGIQSMRVVKEWDTTYRLKGNKLSYSSGGRSLKWVSLG